MAYAGEANWTSTEYRFEREWEEALVVDEADEVEFVIVSALLFRVRVLEHAFKGWANCLRVTLVGNVRAI